jgi:CspA family cold shock protein
MEGTVKWFNARKGYGFIIGQDGTEYFVHYTGLDGIKFVRENDKVSFEPVDSDKGKQAQKVKLLQKGSESSGSSSEAASESDEENVI